MVGVLPDKAIQKGTSTAPRARHEDPLPQDRQTSKRSVSAVYRRTSFYRNPLNHSLGNTQTILLLTCKYCAVHTYSSNLILDQYFYSAESRGRFRLRSTLSLLVRILLPSGVTVEEKLRVLLFIDVRGFTGVTYHSVSCIGLMKWAGH